MFSASLQWVEGAVREGVTGGLQLPLRVSRRSLRERLYSRTLPHSFLVLRGDRWVVEPPLRAAAEFGGYGSATVAEEEEGQGADDGRRSRH